MIPDLKSLRLVTRCKQINSYDIVWWGLCGRSMCVIEAHWKDVWPRFYWGIKRRYVSHKTLWMNWHQNRYKKMNWPHTYTHTKIQQYSQKKNELKKYPEDGVCMMLPKGLTVFQCCRSREYEHGRKKAQAWQESLSCHESRIEKLKCVDEWWEQARPLAIKWVGKLAVIWQKWKQKMINTSRVIMWMNKMWFELRNI